MNLTTNTQKTYTVEVYNWNTEVFELSESLYIDSNEQIIDGSTNETVDEYYLMDELIYECSSDTQFDDILYLCVKDENDEIIYETESFNLINNSDLTATNTFNSYNKDNWTYKIKCDDTFDIDKLEVHSDTSVSYDGEEFYYLDCDGTGKGSDYNIQSEKEYKKTKKKIVPEAPKVEVSPEETKEKPISVMSVFNGIGAFSESLMQLDIDYDMKMVCEIDEAANETFYANNEYDKARHTDDINVLLDEVEENLDLDILCMTPECTSFSTQGSRKGFDSVSGNLTKVAIELFQKVQPKVLLLENVFSMTHHEKYIHTYKRKDGTTFETYKKLSKKEFAKTDLEYMGQHELYLKSKINPDFKNTIGRTFSITEQLFLEKNGKDYNFYWKKMSPNHYGAPQHRQRLILVGIRKDLDKGFQFPKEKDLEFTVADILEKDKSRIDEKLYFKTDLELTLKNTLYW
jgi:site-specific DNA-cytosine methylase